MRFAFVLDPLASLKAYKDSTIAMMRAAQLAGHAVWTIQQPAIYWSELRGVCAEAVHLEMLDDDHEWYVELERHVVPLRDFAAVVMRKDPPFDMEYVTTTWLLQRAEDEGARVFNKPQALRDHSEVDDIVRDQRQARPNVRAVGRGLARLMDDERRLGQAGQGRLDKLVYLTRALTAAQEKYYRKTIGNAEKGAPLSGIAPTDRCADRIALDYRAPSRRRRQQAPRLLVAQDDPVRAPGV